VATKSRKDTSGGEPRKAELLSPFDVPKPEGDPGPINTYTNNPVYTKYPNDPLDLLPGKK